MTYLISFLAVMATILAYFVVGIALVGFVKLVVWALFKSQGIKKWYYRREGTIAILYILLCIIVLVFFGTMLAHDKMFGAVFP